MYDPANNFDDTLNEIVTALHGVMKIKGEPGAAFDDGNRLTVTLPDGEVARMFRAALAEMEIPINTVRPGQQSLLTPSAIRKGKVR